MLDKTKNLVQHLVLDNRKQAERISKPSLNQCQSKNIYIRQKEKFTNLKPGRRDTIVSVFLRDILVPSKPL